MQVTSFLTLQENGGSIISLEVSDTPDLMGRKDSQDSVVQDKDKREALLSYGTTPLSFGYSPAELMFGRALRSLLGKLPNRVADYSQFEETARDSSRMASSKWDAKHRSGTLP